MLFSSYGFIFLFAPVVVSVYLLMGGGAYANLWLLASSLVFYAFQSVQCLPILIVSILVNYAAGVNIIRLRDSGRARLVFILGLVFNLVILGFFKYADFIISTINYFGADIPLLNVILPPGISFFTITEMIYLVDVYQGVTKDKSLVNYAVFVSFFPHILAGPILWHKPMIKQLSDDTRHKINWDNIAKGLTLFIIGLAKKVILADNLAEYVNTNFAVTDKLTVLDGGAVAMAYTFQIYFDFSGYSDMAVGLALMMNLDIPYNFDSPYKAYGMIDYWNRWHMSLTQAITNYIYTPILRSFREITFGHAMFATFIAMLIAGLWHGAGWTYIVFGALHGMGLVLNHVWKKYKLWMPKPLGYVLMCCLILTANIFFRADSVNDALNVFYAIAGGNGFALPRKLALLAKSLFGIDLLYKTGLLAVNKISFTIAIVIAFFCPSSLEMSKKFTPSIKWLVFVAGILAVSLCSYNTSSVFVYFQF